MATNAQATESGFLGRLLVDALNTAFVEQVMRHSSPASEVPAEP